jgi:large subunit ribosomal protein L24
MAHIRKDDIVAVITGDDAPTTGRVLQVLTEKNKVLVEGVNRVYKHLKPNRRNAQGGRLSKEMPISLSNVLLFCPTCKRGVRIGKRYEKDGSKVRVCRKCHSVIGKLSKPRAAYVEDEG